MRWFKVDIMYIQKEVDLTNTMPSYFLISAQVQFEDFLPPAWGIRIRPHLTKADLVGGS